MSLNLRQVQERAWAAYLTFNNRIQSLPTHGAVTDNHGQQIAFVTPSQAQGFDYLYNCGIAPETMDAKDADNLVRWWKEMFPSYSAPGESALPPAKNNQHQWEIHLFQYNDKAKPQPDQWWRYRFNFHVPLSGQVKGPVQLKGYQKDLIRRGKTSYAAMGVTFRPKGQNS